MAYRGAFSDRKGAGLGLKFLRCGARPGFTWPMLKSLLTLLAFTLLAAAQAQSIDVKQTSAYRRIKAHIDATPGRPLQPHHVGSRRQSRRGHLRSDRIHPPLPRRSPGRKS